MDNPYLNESRITVPYNLGKPYDKNQYNLLLCSYLGALSKAAVFRLMVPGAS